MISRRTLFARLTAVALAPLAKWLPKEELYLRQVGTCEIIPRWPRATTPESILNFPTVFCHKHNDGLMIGAADGIWYQDSKGAFWPMGRDWPAPREEA